MNYEGSRGWASLIVQSVKNLSAMQETQVKFLGQEDPLEKEIATHSIILAWRIPWTEEPSRLQSMGSQESDMTQRLNHLKPRIWGRDLLGKVTQGPAWLQLVKYFFSNTLN